MSSLLLQIQIIGLNSRQSPWPLPYGGLSRMMHVSSLSQVAFGAHAFDPPTQKDYLIPPITTMSPPV